MTITGKPIQTHLEEPCQDREGARYLDSACVPYSNVYLFSSIGAVHHKATVWGHPLHHTADHDTDHSERTWTQKKSEDTPSVPANEPVTSPTDGDVSGCAKYEVNQHWV